MSIFHSKNASSPTYFSLFGTVIPSLQDQHHLFEQFLVIGLPPSCDIKPTHHNETMNHEPQVLFSFPPDKPLMNSMIPHFCFPNGLKTTAMQRAFSGSGLNSVLFSPMAQLEEPRNSFVFLLTGDATVYYGVCILRTETLDGESTFFNPRKSLQNSFSENSSRLVPSGFDITVPRVYCLVSRFPFIKMHFHVLFSVLERERMLLFMDCSNTDKGAEDLSSSHILDYYYKLKRPRDETANITLSIPGNSDPATFYCPEDDDTLQLSEWGMFHVLNRLEQEDLFAVISYLLQEQSVLVASAAPGLLSAFVFSILILMKPFLWQCAVVPLLPKKLWESLEAPIPFFIGIYDPPSKFIDGEHDYLIVDLDHNMLIRPTKYVPMMPGIKSLNSVISRHQQQFKELQHAPLQHRRSKLVEDVITAFRENHRWLMDEVSRAVMTVLEGKSKENRSSPPINFLDDEENMRLVLSCFEEEHQAFFFRFFRTQLFSVHSQELLKNIAKSGVGKDFEVLGMLTQLILMEEKSKEVLQEYARRGMISYAISPGLSHALNETQSVLDLLRDSKKRLENEVTKRKILTKRNIFSLFTNIANLGGGESRKGHRRTKSLSEQLETKLALPLAPPTPAPPTPAPVSPLGPPQDSPRTARRRSTSNN